MELRHPSYNFKKSKVISATWLNKRSLIHIPILIIIWNLSIGKSALVGAV